MTTSSATVEPDSGPEWLERALRDDAVEHRATHVDDAGFTAGVLAALPAPAAVPRWRRPVEWALWGIAGVGVAASLPSFATEVARELFRLVAAQPVSLPQMVTAIAAVGVLTFGSAAYVLRRD